MKKVVIDRLDGKRYCVLIVNKTCVRVVFYSMDGLTSNRAFFECRDVALAIKTALGHKDMRLHYTDTNDAAARYHCDESELLHYERK